MARTAGTSARTQRLIAVAATCFLGAVTAFAIGRVFQGHAATYRLLAAALASALLACALERRNLLAATVVSAAALLVAIGMLIFPSTTWHGLPTLDTLHAIGRAAGLVGQQARIQVAPSLPLPPLMLAALTATWAAVFSSHALAFRAGSPLLALLPPIALVGFADTVLDQFVKPLYGVAFLAAALLVIFADGLRRLQGWGPVWTGPGRDARLTRTAGRGARRLAIACLAIALVTPALMPGFASKGFWDFSTKGSGPVTLDPFVNIANQLSSTDDKPVFTVKATHGTYYRMVALSTYNDSAWSYDQNPTSEAAAEQDLPLPSEIDPSLVNEFPQPEQQFRTESEIATQWLPAPYPATSTTFDQPLALDPQGSSLGLQGTVGAGTDYNFTSLRLTPKPADLRSLSFGPAEPNATYTTLPAETEQAVAPIARKWVGAATGEYDQVMAILRKFHSAPFVYDDKAAAAENPDGTFPLMNFLTKTHRGFCQQFAGSMAVMLRALGIPARVAVGYSAGQPIGYDTWEVSQHDAHAWVEVLFPRYGWLTFDPTPSAEGQTTTSYNDWNATVTPCKRKDCVGGSGGKGTRPNTTRTWHRRDVSIGVGSSTGSSESATTPAKTITGRRIIAACLLLGLVVLLLVPLVRTWRRRRRLHRAGREPRRLILATYDVFTERAAELGFPRGPGETLEEYRRRVAGSGRLSDGHLHRLTQIASNAAYAEEEPNEEDSREASAAAATTLKDLQRTAPWKQRILGHYRREG